MAESLSTINIEQLSNAVRSVFTPVGQTTLSAGHVSTSKHVSNMATIPTAPMNRAITIQPAPTAPKLNLIAPKTSQPITVVHNPVVVHPTSLAYTPEIVGGSAPIMSNVAHIHQGPAPVSFNVTHPVQNGAPVSFILPVNNQFIQPAMQQVSNTRLQTIAAPLNIVPASQPQQTLILTSQANNSQAIFIPGPPVQTIPQGFQLASALQPQQITKTIQALPVGVQTMPSSCNLQSIPAGGAQLLPGNFVTRVSQASVTQPFVQTGNTRVIGPSSQQQIQAPSGVQVANIPTTMFTRPSSTTTNCTMSSAINNIVTSMPPSGIGVSPIKPSHHAVQNHQMSQPPGPALAAPANVVSAIATTTTNSISQSEGASCDGSNDSLHGTAAGGQNPGFLDYQVLEMLLDPHGKSSCQPAEVNQPRSQDEVQPTDQGFYCLACQKSRDNPCDEHHADYKVVTDSTIPTRAVASLPKNLMLKPSNLHKENNGVWSKFKIACNTVFSPLSGAVRLIDNPLSLHGKFHLWKVFNEDGSYSHLIDCLSEDESNWLRFLKRARSAHEQNVVAYQHGKNICFMACKDVPENTELQYWFAPSYASLLEVPLQPDDSHQCRICEKFFVSATVLKNHYRYTHPDISSNKWRCSVCDRTFRSSSKLETHMFIHMGLKPHMCKTCHKHFTDASNLRQHMMIHSDERKFECNVCDRRFRQKAHLKSHMLLHGDAKRVKCRYCEKTFSRSFDAQQHERVHTKEKLFPCEQCGFVFYKQFNYKKHMKIHEGIRDYECSACHKRFVTKYHVNRHKLTCKGVKQLVVAPDIENADTNVASSRRTSKRVKKKIECFFS